MFGISRSLPTAVLASLLVVASSRYAFAMPENDLFANAEVLEGESGQVSGSNVRGTREPGEPFHAGNRGGASIWYKWTAPRGGLLTVYTFGSSFDSTLAAYSGDTLEDLQIEEENDDGDVGLFQSIISFRVFTGRDYHIAVDGFNAATGNVLLSWFLGSTGARPPNDNFERSQRIESDSGRVFGTTFRGTVELDEPQHHLEQAGSSIWFTWSSPMDGEVTFSTEGITFLHVLTAYEGSDLGALKRLGRDSPVDRIDPDIRDIPFQDTPSEIRFRVEEGGDYHIVIDGVFASAGIAVLNWLVTIPCDPPEAPRGPSPVDNAVGVGRAVTLRWNQEQVFVERLIFGDDTRQDAFEVINPDFQELFDSVAILLPLNELTDNGDGTFTLEDPLTLGETATFCETERFFDQPAPGVCSAFLAGEDRVVMASSCIGDSVDCNAFVFVFGFEMQDSSTPTLNFDQSQVYFCNGIIARQSNPAGAEWEVIQLDRPVEGRAPLRVRRRGTIDDDAELVYIGHPFGLPTKIDASGTIRENSADEFFVAGIDSSFGSFGAPVLNKDTLMVEGIVVRGEQDTVEQDGCFVSRRCGEDDCRGQDVTRATEFEHMVPPDLADLVFEVWFGEVCSNLEMVGETSDTQFRLPERLETNKIYCWRIAARNECGVVFSPRWSFVTTGVEDTVFRRGDANADGVVNLSDGVSLLAFLFQQGEAPGCIKSADVDDNSDVNITDAVFVLNHLFLQGSPPVDPFAECGTDPTPEDGVSCESYPPCAVEG